MRIHRENQKKKKKKQNGQQLQLPLLTKMIKTNKKNHSFI